MESTLRGARAFYDAVCRINVKLDFKSKASMDNGPILASLQTYCWMISDEREVLNEPRPMQGKPTTVRLKECKSKTDLRTGYYSVHIYPGCLNVIYDDCEIRQGISPRFRRSEALHVAKLIAAYLRDLEQLGELPVSSPEDD